MSKIDIDLFLWSKVKTGDKESFELLFDKYYTLLCLLSKRYTHDISAAREIIQNLFIYLWEHRVELNITISLKAYLLRAVKYNSIRYIEKDRKIGIRMNSFPDTDHDTEFIDHIEYAELQEKILETIDALPDQCKKVFKMSRFEQLKYADIAQRLAISVKTVESHITKALRILQEKLQEN